MQTCSDILNSSDISDSEKELLQQSFNACVVDQSTRLPVDQRNADAFNGMIVILKKKILKILWKETKKSC